MAPTTIRPRRTTRRAAPAALATAVLLGAAACSAIEVDPERPTAPPSSPSAAGVSRSPAPAAPAALTAAQAQSALITWADLGEPWAPTQGAAPWRDAFLKVRVARGTAPDCQRLLDALYADELLGAPARAVVGLDDTYHRAQLRHQITTQRPAAVDRTLGWLRTLPGRCATFAATSANGTAQRVEVAGAELPEEGDARQGLRVTSTIEYRGEPVSLTVDVAVVRVGRDAFTLTNGGLGDVRPEVTAAAVRLGAERLAAVRKQGRVLV
ncbi:hypothetical protein [Streptomyces glaucescens]|uniref:Secreted protein n=1 Tax=Streptomyces glaucescens TaxID=1907 RepID=A0A089XC78_STRGA|nr:hypothetical protein [Streptomyces glaucescens]AIR99516.1 secreted protein [Streptomyces glaucescens]